MYQMDDRSFHVHHLEFPRNFIKSSLILRVKIAKNLNVRSQVQRVFVLHQRKRCVNCKNCLCVYRINHSINMYRILRELFVLNVLMKLKNYIPLMRHL